MKTVGMIVEYNPFHNGHLYHLQQSKKITGTDAAVAVMSGNFLQRGEPALINKWARTKMALCAGIDLVIELPSTFANQPAEWFAFGAVSALESSGIVDAVCFGSENGNLEPLKQLAQILVKEDESFKIKLQEKLKSGLSYPAAYSEAAKSFIIDSGRIDGFPDISLPNNSLGLHYLIALLKLKSTIKPFTISRTKAGYNQKEISDEEIASATAIRQLITQDRSFESIKPYVPSYTFRILKEEFDAGRGPLNWEHFSAMLYHTLIALNHEQLADIYEVTEGLEYRLKQALYNNADQKLSVEHLLTTLKTKRYTRTKLQRMLLHIIFHNTKKHLNRSILSRGVPYLRVLGFSHRGRLLLKKMKKTASVPVITNITKQDAAMLDADIKASSIHALAYKNHSNNDLFREFRQPPLQL